jgi:uncharacterized protein
VKYLMVIAVVGVLLWLMLGRNRRVGGGGPAKAATARPASPVEMIECAHCKVHLPRTDARFDAAGHPYCGDAHRVAGPR